MAKACKVFTEADRCSARGGHMMYQMESFYGPSKTVQFQHEVNNQKVSIPATPDNFAALQQSRVQLLSDVTSRLEKHNIRYGKFTQP